MSTPDAPEADAAVPPADVTVVEAPTARKALEEVNARFGSRADIVGASKVLRGGVGGFFAKEMIQLRVRTSSGAVPEAGQRAAGGAAGPVGGGPGGGAVGGGPGGGAAVGGGAGTAAAGGAALGSTEGGGRATEGVGGAAATESAGAALEAAAAGGAGTGTAADAVERALGRDEHDDSTPDRTPAVTRLLAALTGSAGEREQSFAQALRSQLARDTGTSMGAGADQVHHGLGEVPDNPPVGSGGESPETVGFAVGASSPGAPAVAGGGASGTSNADASPGAGGGAASPSSAGTPAATGGGAAARGGRDLGEALGALGASRGTPVGAEALVAGCADDSQALDAPREQAVDSDRLVAGHAEARLRASARTHLAGDDAAAADAGAPAQAPACAGQPVAARTQPSARTPARQPLAPAPVATASAPHLAVPVAEAAGVAPASRDAAAGAHGALPIADGAGVAPASRDAAAGAHGALPIAAAAGGEGRSGASVAPGARAAVLPGPGGPATTMREGVPARPAGGADAAVSEGVPARPAGGAARRAWRSDAVEALGLPRLVLDALARARDGDDVERLRAIAASVASLCRPLPAGLEMLIGPRAGTLSPALGVPLVQPPGPTPAAGPVAAAVGAEHRDWIRAQRASRWLHLVAGGTGWDALADDGAMAVSWATAHELPAALRMAADRGLVLGYDGWRGARRADPVDVAVTVRELVMAR